MPRVLSSVLSLWPTVTWAPVLPLERKYMDSAMFMTTLTKLKNLGFPRFFCVSKKSFFMECLLKCHSKFEHCGQMALRGYNL